MAAFSLLLLIYLAVLVLTRPGGGDDRGYTVAALLTGVLVALSAFGFFVALITSGGNFCDTTCPGPTWSKDPDAWQFSAQLYAAGVGLIATILALGCIAKNARALAFVATLIASGGWIAWLIVWS